VPPRRSTDLLPPDRPGAQATRSPGVVVRPASEGGNLAGGTLVEASVVARLLRIKLLTLDASVLLLPAVAESSALPAASSGERRVLEASSARPQPAGTPRRRLADATRSIDEGAAILARARQNRRSLDAPRDGPEATAPRPSPYRPVRRRS
jgi:hypothetical protein